MPPKLTGLPRRAGRERGKSDPIDALAVARVALREPDLTRPRPGEERYRELKLLVVTATICRRAPPRPAAAALAPASDRPALSCPPRRSTGLSGSNASGAG